MPLRSNSADRRKFFLCSICNEFVELETAKIYESGKPVHEECYVQQVSLKRSIRPTPTALDTNSKDDHVFQSIVTFLNSADTYTNLNFCPECGTQLQHAECSFFYKDRSWKINLKLCLNCNPNNEVPPHDA